jgi:hypothetical protein
MGDIGVTMRVHPHYYGLMTRLHLQDDVERFWDLIAADCGETAA